MKMRSQAGRDHSSGDQIIVPKEGTRSSKMWLRMPAAEMPASVGNEGASHFRRLANARVIPARSSAQSGKSTSECVRLRCHVTMSSLSLEKKSRSTSESGKIAPTINDQVVMRPRFIGCEGNKGAPRNKALSD